MYLISDGGINTNDLDTMEAVMLTKYKKSLDGVKIDIRKTKDNIFVLARFEELEKFTYGKGNIRENNYSFIRKIKFPSHIFKYYIPTLDEVLKKYKINKIIVLEIYNINNLDQLFNILVKYNYRYYFISRDRNIVNKLKELDFDKIGNILNIERIIYQKNNYFLIKD